jgi:hypothetical protein
VLQASGQLTSSKANKHDLCTVRNFPKAKGTTNWSFKLRLPKGSYTIFARATDSTGRSRRISARRAETGSRSL